MTSQTNSKYYKCGYNEASKLNIGDTYQLPRGKVVNYRVGFLMYFHENRRYPEVNEQNIITEFNNLMTKRVRDETNFMNERYGWGTVPTYKPLPKATSEDP